MRVYTSSYLLRVCSHEQACVGFFRQGTFSHVCVGVYAHTRCIVLSPPNKFLINDIVSVVQLVRILYRLVSISLANNVVDVVLVVFVDVDV